MKNKGLALAGIVTIALTAIVIYADEGEFECPSWCDQSIHWYCHEFSCDTGCNVTCKRHAPNGDLFEVEGSCAVSSANYSTLITTIGNGLKRYLSTRKIIHNFFKFNL